MNGSDDESSEEKITSKDNNYEPDLEDALTDNTPKINAQVHNVQSIDYV